jgi:hypothetical protein
MHEHFAGLIHQANVHRLGVQIDTAVECVLPVVKSHPQAHGLHGFFRRHER